MSHLNKPRTNCVLIVLCVFCIAYCLTYVFIAYILIVESEVIIMNKKYTYNEYLKDDNNKQVREIADSLKSIASSLKFFEVIILNDSNYTSKNKKDIDTNVNKINEVVKYVKYKL